MFEEEYEKFLASQRRSATGARLELLNKDMTGEKKLLSNVLWPVLKSFDGITLEHEIVSLSGVRIFIDTFIEPLKLAVETEGFVVHAENVTRDRFSFERMRIRTMATYGITFVPFSWDELDKKPEVCRRSIYEIIGRYTSLGGNTQFQLSVYEREVLRYGLSIQRPIRLKDVNNCLQLKSDASRGVLKSLLSKNIIKPIGSGSVRHHEYILVSDAIDYLA